MSKGDAVDYGALLRDAYRTIERLEARVGKLQKVKTEPLAIVGMSCRVPGANDPAAYWEILRNGVDAVREIPASRWDADEYYDATGESAGKMATRWGGFLDEVDRFDAPFFGISPREAVSMDPQQRLLLEVAWEALEHAGIAPDSLMGSRTGAFVGISTTDYAQLQTTRGDPAVYDAYLATGNSHSVASGRLAYVLGLQGPTFSVDTACSSSLIAVHLACQALRTGTCDAALACGVNLILAPETTAMLSKAQMMSRHGRCKTFSADADGFVRGEGCGVLVIKRLSSAQAAGDRILALIRGSAINQDGRSNGLTAPNGQAQAAVIRAALADAGLAPREVSYVEAHGTGTPLGDPIEVQALAEALGEGRTAENPLLIGSAKTNIGHLEAAAGVAGLIKVVLALQHGEIPPHLHLRERNPNIAWNDYPIDVPTVLTPFPATGQAPIAAVSSFGFSGSNAHVVLQAPPPPAATEDKDGRLDRPVHVLALSAKTPTALRAVAERYAGHLEEHSEAALADVCFTANTGRAHFGHRLAVTAVTAADARRRLAAFASGSEQAAPASADVGQAPQPEIAFLFTGQGAQYVGMGRGLYETQPAFRAALDRCAAILDSQMDAPLLSVLFGDDPARLDQTGFAQPSLFAVEYALAELWRSWGVRPTFVLGHSVGEIVAACVAGVFSLEDALRLTAARGRLMQALPAGGAMAAVMAEAGRLPAVIGSGSGVSIAGLNGPDNTVISGPIAEIERAMQALAQAGIRAQRLKVSHAFHSALLDPMLPALEDVAAQIRCTPPQVRLVSNLTGGLVHEEVCRARYWSEHARRPVRFADGVSTLYEQGCRAFVEIGPAPVLVGMARRVVACDDARWIASLRNGRDDSMQIAEAVCDLYLAGAEIDWRAFDAPFGRRRVALPTYPFARHRYWLEPPAEDKAAVEAGARTTASRVCSAVTGEIVTQVEMSPSQDFLTDHRVHGTVIFPAAGFLSLALSAAAAARPGRASEIAGFVLHEPLVFSGRARRLVQSVLTPADDGAFRFAIFSAEAGEQPLVPPAWRRHASGTLRASAAEPADHPSLSAVRSRCALAFAPADYYGRAQQTGVEYGPSYRRLVDLTVGTAEAVGQVLPMPTSDAAASDMFPPAMIDAAFQVLGAVLMTSVEPSEEPGASPLLPVGAGRVFAAPELTATGPLWACAKMRDRSTADRSTMVGDLWCYDQDGRLLLAVEEFTAKRAPREALLGPDSRRLEEWLYRVEWQPAEATATAAENGVRRWIVCGPDRQLAGRLAGELAELGNSVSVTTDGEGLQASGDAPVGIVYAAAHEAADAACRSLVGAIQGLPRRPELDIRLWVVTQGGQQVVPSDVPDPTQAALGAVAQIARAEYPSWGVEQIDLPADGVVAMASIVRELHAAGDEARVAFRGDQRWVARLARIRAADGRSAAGDTPAFDPEASYLVTGGLGALGLVAAGWLVAGGARHLTLLGRRGPDDNALQTIRTFEAAGAEVEVVSADVGRECDVRRALEIATRNGRQLRGVVHAAGVVADALLERQSPEALDQVLAPKVAGVDWLDGLTRQHSLDHFILFSSMASLLGTPGQAAYAAASAYLDAVARRRSSEGLPALSVNWGPWAGSGMVSRLSPAERQRIADTGVSFISPDQGIACLQRALMTGAPQVAVLPVQWDRLAAQYERNGPPSLLRDLLRARATVEADRPATRAPSLREQLNATPLSERDDLVRTFVRGQVALILRQPADGVGQRTPFSELGLDSLMGVELRNALSAATGVELPASIVYDCPSVHDLAKYLTHSVFELDDRPTTRPPRAVPSSLPVDLDEVSTDGLAALLSASMTSVEPEDR